MRTEDEEQAHSSGVDSPSDWRLGLLLYVSMKPSRLQRLTEVFSPLQIPQSLSVFMKKASGCLS